MAAMTEAQRILKIASQALEALETIGSLVAPVTGVSNHDTTALVGIIAAIKAVVDTIGGGMTGDISVDDVEKRIAELRSVLAGNDAAADAALAAKFPS